MDKARLLGRLLAIFASLIGFAAFVYWLVTLIQAGTTPPSVFIVGIWFLGASFLAMVAATRSSPRHSAGAALMFGIVGVLGIESIGAVFLTASGATGLAAGLLAGLDRRATETATQQTKVRGFGLAGATVGSAGAALHLIVLAKEPGTSDISTFLIGFALFMVVAVTASGAIQSVRLQLLFGAIGFVAAAALTLFTVGFVYAVAAGLVGFAARQLSETETTAAETTHPN